MKRTSIRRPFLFEIKRNQNRFNYLCSMRNLIAFLRRFQIFLVFAILQALALASYFSFFTQPKTQFMSSISTVSASLWEKRNAITKHFSFEAANNSLQKANMELLENQHNALQRVDRNTVIIEDTTYIQKFEYLAADIINSSFNRANNYFTINIGELQGVKVGWGVVSDHGIVGVIHSVSKHYALVKSVLSERINVDVEIPSVGLPGLLKWDGKSPKVGSVAGISNDLDIPKWSKVVTKGGSGIFPKGLLVGKVYEMFEVEGQAFWDVRIYYSEDYRKLQKVYVVHNLLLEEQRNLEAEVNGQSR